MDSIFQNKIGLTVIKFGFQVSSSFNTARVMNYGSGYCANIEQPFKPILNNNSHRLSCPGSLKAETNSVIHFVFHYSVRTNKAAN